MVKHVMTEEGVTIKNALPVGPIRLIVWFTLLVCLSASYYSFAEELRMYAAAGVKAPLIEMAAEFEKTNGQKIALVFDTAGGAE